MNSIDIYNCPNPSHGYVYYYNWSCVTKMNTFGQSTVTLVEMYSDIQSIDLPSVLIKQLKQFLHYLVSILQNMFIIEASDTTNDIINTPNLQWIKNSLTSVYTLMDEPDPITYALLVRLVNVLHNIRINTQFSTSSSYDSYIKYHLSFLCGESQSPLVYN